MDAVAASGAGGDSSSISSRRDRALLLVLACPEERDLLETVRLAAEAEEGTSICAGEWVAATSGSGDSSSTSSASAETRALRLVVDRVADVADMGGALLFLDFRVSGDDVCIGSSS